MTRIAIVGVGKIARDQHIPHIKANPAFDWVAGVTRDPSPLEVPDFRTITEMMKAGLGVQAVSICTPPIGRLALIQEAFANGLDVLLEKPPAATLSEAETFAELARSSGRLIYMTWHAREAAAVEPARTWLQGKAIRSVLVEWRENVRQWHPGQEWIWEPGIGVFDPGINALSVITRILPAPLHVDSAELFFPANRASPIAANLALGGPFDGPFKVELTMNQQGPQTWDVTVETDVGTLELEHGASKMAVDGQPVDVGNEEEYAALYRHFADLLARRESDIDLSPFRLVADCYLIGRRNEVAAFSWT